MKTKKLSPKKNNQKNKHENKWDLSPLYAKDTDPQIEKDLQKFKKLSYAFISKWQNRKDYLKNPKVLKEALFDYETWLDKGGILGEIGYYFSLRSAQDENNFKLKARLNQIDDFATKISNDATFFTLNLSKIPKTIQKKFLKDKNLARWHHFLTRLFETAKYSLSEPEEKIMQLKSNPAHTQWVNMLSSLLAKETKQVYNSEGKLAELPFAQVVSLTAHPTKKIRDKAAVAFNEVLAKYADVAEAEINAILLNKKTNDEIRNLPRADSSRHISDDVSPEVVDALVEEVTNFFPLSRKYYSLKAKVLKKPQLAYHERNIPVGKTVTKYPYKKAVNLVSDVFKDLDPEFHKFFQHFIDNNQIDVFPYAGKSGGAFCAYNSPTAPTYILLNHTGQLRDVLTLAHEAGHGINDEFMKEAQTELYFGTPLVTAEVASTFTEDFVLEKLLTKAKDEEKLSLMFAKLDDEISTVIRQVAAYKFETELHRTFRAKGYLSKEEIGQIFQKNMKAYMGPGVEQSEGSANWWIYWSHFRNFFYVYSYASGILISKSLQRSVRENPEFIENIKEFLRAGVSDSPENIFKKIGVDINDRKFWRAGLEEIAELLEESKRLAKKLGKI